MTEFKSTEPVDVLVDGAPQFDLKKLPISQLRENEWNPNQMDDASFNRLTEELQDVGMIDPLQVVPMEDGTYLIIGGAHRYQAAKVLGWDTIPCVLLSEAKWQDQDLCKLVTVRLNSLHGKLNPTKMVALYQEMASKYGEDALKGLFAFSDTDAWEKLTKGIAAGLSGGGLPKEIAAKFNEAAKEAKSVDDLSKILNHLFNTYGDTLRYNFMVFTYGNQEHIYVALDKKAKKSIDAVLSYCKESGTDLNEVIGPVSQAWVKQIRKSGAAVYEESVDKPLDGVDS